MKKRTKLIVDRAKSQFQLRNTNDVPGSSRVKQSQQQSIGDKKTKQNSQKPLSTTVHVTADLEFFKDGTTNQEYVQDWLERQHSHFKDKPSDPASNNTIETLPNTIGNTTSLDVARKDDQNLEKDVRTGTVLHVLQNVIISQPIMDNTSTDILSTSANSSVTSTQMTSCLDLNRDDNHLQTETVMGKSLQPTSTDSFVIQMETLSDENDDDSVKDKDYYPDTDENRSVESVSEEEEMNETQHSEEEDENGENEVNGIEQDENVVEENDDTENEFRSRKRQRNPERWKRNIKKLKVNTGKSYISEGNREIPAKRIKKPCKCKLKCFEICEADRKVIFSRFWALADNQTQRQFVVAHMESVNPKYRRVLEDSNRSNNIAYHFTINSVKKRVCKTFFMNTLNIGDRFIRTSWAKSKNTSITEKIKMGNYLKRQTVSEELKNSVREHINRFERIESHYLRAQTTREYLDGSLTLTQMYRYYKEERERENLSFAKKCTYETIFNSEFNISFFTPKKDQCAVCEAYKNSNVQEKEQRQEEYTRHILNKENCRKEKKKDITESEENNNLIVACFDLQAVMPVPCGEVATFFYKCRLNCFNFTIYEITSKNGYCYFWNEAIALRGANEIATCIFTYLSTLPDGKDIIFYSDNCVGQNKNKMVLAMYLYVVSQSNLNSITHKFLTVGHTQNEGDSMHSVIEKAKKRVLKGGPICVPSQLPPIIRTAKKDGKPYKVKEMDTQEFFNFKELSKLIEKAVTKNTENEKVVWNSIQVFKVEKKSPGKVFYKTGVKSSTFNTIDLTNRRFRDMTQVILQKAYATPPTVKDKTKEHLLELCKMNLVEKVHQHYYQNLFR